MFILQTRWIVLKHEGAENFNWNYVDQHILGYQDFTELPEIGNILSNAVVKENLLFVFNSLHGFKNFSVVTCYCQQR